MFALVLGQAFAWLDSPLLGNPTQGVVATGGALITSQGSQLTIKTSGNTVINWGTFNIASGESTVFVQPSV